MVQPQALELAADHPHLYKECIAEDCQMQGSVAGAPICWCFVMLQNLTGLSSTLQQACCK